MFPGADSDRSEARYALIGAPLDASTTFQPGTRFGPDRIRHVAQSFEDYDHRTDQLFRDLAVYDHGDIEPGDDTTEYLEFLRGTVEDFHRQGTVPALIGGEHTVTIGALRALEPSTYVVLDAHLDLRESYAGNTLSHATVTRHALDIVDEAIILGARSGSEAEWNRTAEADVTVYEPTTISEWEPPDPTESVYVSIDIDAADPGFAPGTGTPEPFGLTPQTIRRIIHAVAPASIGFDVVEVNDRDDGQAAVLGAKLLRECIFAHAAGT